MKITKKANEMINRKTRERDTSVPVSFVGELLNGGLVLPSPAFTSAPM
jgi:hypothetical protein